jgi:hypothetical protein
MNAKQATQLLVLALLISMTGWAFWHYLGSEADSVLAAIVIIGLVLDNIRLRKQVQNKNDTAPP